MKPLLLASVVAMLGVTSCNKENLTETDADSPSPHSLHSSIANSADNKDSEIVEFDGFVNISAPIAKAIEDGSYEGVSIIESGFEMPVFTTSGSEVPMKPNQNGEQDGGVQPSTRPESK